MSRLRAGALAGLGLLLALGATIGPPPMPSAQPGASLTVRLADPIGMVVVGLFAASILLFLSLQRRRRATEDDLAPGREPGPPARRSALLASLPLLLLLIGLIYLTWTWPPGTAHPLEAPLAAIAGLLELLAHARKPPTSVPFFDYAVAGLALGLALATFALMVLVVLADRVLRWWSGPLRTEAARPLDEAVAAGLDDLRADPDARAAIIRAYRRFELALADARVPRAAWQTPSEFMRAALAQVSVPGQAIERLTALFELARFSERPLGPEAREAAYACLDAVRTALETDPPHAR